MLGQETAVLLLLCGGVLLLMAAVTNGAGFSLDGIKGRTVGDGQTGRHGLPVRGKYGARSTGCGSGRGRGDGESIFQRYRGWWWAVKCAANV